MRISSVREAFPSTIQRFLSIIMLYMYDNITTDTVPPTVFTMTGPRPLLTRSRIINTSFLNGVLKHRTMITVISANITVNNNCSIFKRYSFSGTPKKRSKLKGVMQALSVTTNPTPKSTKQISFPLMKKMKERDYSTRVCFSF